MRLAIDTATTIVSVAVGDDAAWAEKTVGPRRGAGGLIPAIDQCLQRAGVTWESIDEILLADGPGSFTGLRVGFSTVAGLTSVRPLPVRVVPSLVAVAWGGAARGVEPDGAPVSVVALFDALRGEVFATRVVVSAGTMQVTIPPDLTTVAALRIADPAPDLIVAAEPGLLDDIGEDWAGVPVRETTDVVRAAHLLELCTVPRVLPPGGEVPTHPNYGRQAEAQVRWEREHGRRISDSTGRRR